MAITVYQQDPNLWRVPQGAQSDGIVQQTLESYTERIATLRHNLEHESSAVSRMHFWKVALRMTEDNPVFGVGLGRYPHEFSKYDKKEGRFGGGRAVHNTPLMVLSETGSAGFLSLCTVLLLCVVAQTKAHRLMRQIASPEETSELGDYVKMLRISIVGSLWAECS